MGTEVIILIIVGIVGLTLISIYNNLVSLRQKQKQAFSDVDVQLKQRYNLVPQLVETVKGYASHEKEVLQKVTDARTGIDNTSNQIGERIQAEKQLSQAMMNLFAVAENYPDLKADTNFRQFMDELSDIENKLAAARRFFNNATAELNTSIEQFPAVLFAGALGFSKEEFFEIPEEDRETLDKAPDVSFN